MAIGTDNGNIETYEIVPEFRLLGRIASAHTWKTANQADSKVRKSNVSSLVIVSSVDGAVLASAGWEDMTIALWDWTTRQNIRTMSTRSYIMRLASEKLESESTLISLSMDLRCKFWQLRTGQLLSDYVDQRVPDRTVPYESESLFYSDMSLAHVAGMDLVSIAARDGTITVINADNIATVTTVSIGYGTWGQSIAMAPNGIIALAGARGITAIKVFDLHAGVGGW
jgi:WD40 repeat protein